MNPKVKWTLIAFVVIVLFSPTLGVLIVNEAVALLHQLFASLTVFGNGVGKK